jgi:hypothetical protein
MMTDVLSAAVMTLWLAQGASSPPANVPSIEIGASADAIISSLPDVDGPSIPPVPQRNVLAASWHSFTLAVRHNLHLEPSPAQVQRNPPSATVALGGQNDIENRPGVLLPLYAAFVTLDALDVHSTTRALGQHDAHEGNPVLGSLVTSKPAFVMTKLVSATLVIWGAERLWKRNRIAAVAIMGGITGMMAIVDIHNYRAGGSVPNYATAP